MKEAMDMVKEELGIDAVILHTKKYKKGGFFGVNGKDVVEVTAAVEDEVKKPVKQKPVFPVMPKNVLNRYKGTTNAPLVDPAIWGDNAGIPENSLQQGQLVEQQSMQQAIPQQHQYMQQVVPQGIQQQPMQRQSVPQSMGPQAIQPQSMQQAITESVQRQPMQQPMPQVIQPQSMQQAMPQGLQQQQVQQAMPQGVQQQPIKQPTPQFMSQDMQPQIAQQEEIQPLTAQQDIHDDKIQKAQADTTIYSQEAHDEEPDSADSSAEENVSDTDGSTSDSENKRIRQLEDELIQMKTLLAQVMSSSPEQEKETVSMQDALKAQDIDDDIITDMIRRMPPEAVMGDKDAPEAAKALKGYLFRALRLQEGIILRKDNKPKIVALIGATGVGKTTTLAKIAARFVLEQGVSAALITADTYRISAVEQLKTYSDIIGLPLEIVYAPDELKDAIRKHRDKQLILIDTAGRSQHNESQMKELRDFLAADEGIERHLVLSATTKNRDAMDILGKFSECRPDHIIFTKTDETASLGLIVNLLSKSRASLSYLTTGQSVPDDIFPARADTLAGLLLR